ncbi:MAG: hypothetical protein HY617_03570 [Candidatus Sungbacteria bacterium]|nr:hypothetical protein [Candidatus Sungbacteria bacterium]
MDLAKLKQFVKQNKDHKFIFVENGEPDLVVMSFAEYERLLEREEDPVGYSNLFQAGAPELEPDIRHDANTPTFGGISPASTSIGSPEFRHPSTEPAPYRKFAAFGKSETVGLPVHLEDIRLEDLPV